MSFQHKEKCTTCHKVIQWNGDHNPHRCPKAKPTQTASMDIDSGLGIGGIGSDDYNMSTEDEGPDAGYVHGDAPAGTQVCPAGTTYGQADSGGRCTRCGAPADWNPGAGQNLCARHWDEY